MAQGEGLTALVTGASAGIGKAFADVFAKYGFNLILTARREDRLLAEAAELQKKHRIKVDVVAADLSDPTAPGRLVAELKARGLRVDALVNNAGYGVPGTYAGTKWEDQRAFIEVLVTAPCELAHRLLPDMVARKKGYIINIASVAGMIPGSAGATLYGASKSFMVQFSRSLHLENERNGVHVTALAWGDPQLHAEIEGLIDSHQINAVELDLKAFKGWTPIEMWSEQPFPPIGELPYFFTLGPHAFYWFRLERGVEA